MAQGRGRSSSGNPADRDNETDFPASFAAGFLAGQQSAGSSFQGLANDSDIRKWLERFATLLEPLQNLAQPQAPLPENRAEQLRDIHASLARVDLSTIGSAAPLVSRYRRILKSQGTAS
jgi:hypothetical protein